MLSLFHPEIIFKNLSAGEITAEAVGIDQFRQMAEQVKDPVFESATGSNRLQLRQGHCLVDIDYEGVLAVYFSNGMKAGKTIKLEKQLEFECKDEKMWGSSLHRVGNLQHDSCSC